MLEACWIFNSEMHFNIDKGTMRHPLFHNPVSQAASVFHELSTPAGCLNFTLQSEKLERRASGVKMI